MMYLHEIKAARPKKKRRKRVGRGSGSGSGKTAGRGFKGQKSRSGSFGNVFFVGGQTPLFRRLPKRGFTSGIPRAAIVNLSDLNGFEDGSVVDIEAMRTAGLIRRKDKRIKILGQGNLEKKLTVKASAFTASAAKGIEDKGGKVEKV